jgi:hypothetical protein
MNLWEREVPHREIIGSLDAATPAKHMQAIDTAMQRYFGIKEWLKERSRQFPGLLTLSNEPDIQN